MGKKTVVSLVETLLLVVLLFVMLVQCIFFISLTQKSTDGSLPEFPESEAKFITSGISDMAGRDKSAVVPYFVGVISENGMYGGLYEDNLSREVFGCFARVLENAPGGTAKKVVYSDDEKKYDYLGNLYYGSQNCYYVKFKNGIEFSVLCQLLSDTYSEIPENPDFVIEDMFLVGGASGEASITAVDGMGNVLKIYPSKNIPFNNEYLETYNNTVKDEFEFVSIDDNISAGVNRYFPSFSYSVGYRTVYSGNFTDFFDIDSESSDLHDFVSVFGMNDDNTKFYKRASDGAMICVEDTTSIEISPNGGFVFLADEDGGNLEELLDYSGSFEYGFFEYADVASKIVSALNDSFGAACALLSLDDIIYENGECRFRYGYTVDGVPVRTGQSYSLELVFSSSSLVSASGRISILTYGDEARTELPQKTAYVLMEKNRGTVSYFGPEYCFSEDPLEVGKAYIKWTVKYGNGNGGMQE